MPFFLHLAGFSQWLAPFAPLASLSQVLTPKGQFNRPEDTLDYISTHLLPSLSTDSDTGERLLFMSYNKVIGGVRIRSTRARPTACIPTQVGQWVGRWVCR